MYVLQLFITNVDSDLDEMKRHMEGVLGEIVKGQFSIRIVDILKNRRLAELNKIEATPTLIRLHPPPSRRVVGNISSLTEVLKELGIPLK